MGATGSRRASHPDWDALFGVAQAQGGYFTTRQAGAAGYSPQLLYTYLANGRMTRVRRGIYRLVHFPASEHEDLMMPWLWAEQAGVFSHETALSLHDLSDVLPSRVHMTVPTNWRRRRLRSPAGLVLHHAYLSDVDRTGFSVPVTTPARTLRDCQEAAVPPGHVHQAVLQARRRGLISEEESAELIDILDRSAASGP